MIISTLLSLLSLYDIPVRSLAGLNISQQLDGLLHQYDHRIRPDHEGRTID